MNTELEQWDDYDTLYFSQKGGFENRTIQAKTEGNCFSENGEQMLKRLGYEEIGDMTLPESVEIYHSKSLNNFALLWDEKLGIIFVDNWAELMALRIQIAPLVYLDDFTKRIDKFEVELVKMSRSTPSKFAAGLINFIKNW